MSDKIVNEYNGKLIITEYGKERILERIADDANFTTFNFTEIVLGDKLNTNYTSFIEMMGNEVVSFPLNPEDIKVEGDTCYIHGNLEVAGEITIQEIGIFERVNNTRKLFAYASGFSMVKSEDVTYDLVIKLELAQRFEPTSYHNFDVALDTAEYALMPRITNMFAALGRFQLDFERCIESNTFETGYNKAQAFMTEHQKTINNLRDMLTLGRYEKVIHKLGNECITDCFYYPSEKTNNYVVKNLKDDATSIYYDAIGNWYYLNEDLTNGSLYFTTDDNERIEYATNEKGEEGFYSVQGIFVPLEQAESSYIDVKGDLQLCNRDNINLANPTSLMIITQLNSMSKEGVILGKMNPNSDEYYFDIRVIYDENRKPADWTDEEKADKTQEEINYNSSIQGWGLQFTIYSYDNDKVYDVEQGWHDERKLVGHYRTKFFPRASEISALVSNETMYTYVYNGDIKNPEIKLYIGTELMNNRPDYIIDNFNYMGPCQAFKNTSTLRNYSQTAVTTTFAQPMFYFLTGIDHTSIIAFNREIVVEDIEYISLVNQS